MSHAEQSRPAILMADGGAPAVRPRWRLAPLTAARIALIPAAVITIVCFYAFIVWTFVISLTRSRLLPVYDFVGFDQYRRLFASARWWTAMENLAIHGTLFIAGCTVAGYALAIMIDRGVRAEGFFRTVFMLPLSMSFIVTGLIWQWMLNPVFGIQDAVRDLGWEGFVFNWIVQPDRAIYTLAIAGIWQQVGLCMALFLAGLRGVDPNVWKAARIDGIPTWRVYTDIVTPMLRPVFFTVFVLLSALVMKSFDLVVALTGGGPGFASDLPARFVVDHILNRQELGLGAAGAFMMLCTVVAVIGPYLYREIHKSRGAR
ncbi:sugar ABC transporter permease (plasmid) [Skermanella rosea]|uniref:carbohydrate ABC transporter permease n=1 Tax=Skermanella rosea TaxID=1817965 RepID=UPI001E2F7FDC|nr:sugar ABC transporter permease [Skermanella rosea]UEM07905.1 sugar ABC transporter permease [Skermanella rosea]